MEPFKVLVLEDAPANRDYLTEMIQIMGYQAQALEQKTEFVTLLNRFGPDLLIMGSSYNSGQVKAFVEVLEREKPGTPVICIQDGAADDTRKQLPPNANVRFIPEHFDSRELKVTMSNLLETPRQIDYKSLEEAIIGESPAILEIKKNIARISQSDVTVLISGESGTGKELVARAVHNLSPRANHPLIKVNCAALPSNLLESELFGYEKGAFTGAFHKKPGKFELAHGGTIFLDEISELQFPMQAKLLQVLQDNEVSALGSTSNVSIDTRVIAATNADIRKMVAEERFRSDLYFRINVVSIYMPPLRERRQDIPLLYQHFLKKYGHVDKDQTPPVKQEIVKRLSNHHWPGNVRELQNFVQGIAVLGGEDSLANNGFGGTVLGNRGTKAKSKSVRGPGGSYFMKRPLKQVCRAAARRAETEAIVEALFYTHWNRRKAAELLQISYKALLNKVKEYGIEERFRELLKRGLETR